MQTALLYDINTNRCTMFLSSNNCRTCFGLSSLPSSEWS